MIYYKKSIHDKKPIRQKKSWLIAASMAALLPSFSLAEEGKNESDAENTLEEIYVTARRREEKLQDVPISMTVFNQRQISENNVTNAGDLATFTPSLSANSRTGGDLTSFSIRGFVQELRTTSSVGTYFADVVALRGSSIQVTGEGAGPGDFFDLQNVQVLKGPQGTLFGRNTTGGAVLLVPNKPSDQLEGYVELSGGNYDMYRALGVINIPMGSKVRSRWGLDHQKRDGYRENITDIGPDDFANVDYTALRGSIVFDIADNIENYSIVKYVHSDNNGTPAQVFDCNPDAGGAGAIFSGLCAQQLADPATNDFYHAVNTRADAKSEIQQWQAINTTTWDISDELTLKNIIAYGNIETESSSDLFGTNFQMPILTGGSQELIFADSGIHPDFKTTDQSTFVEEIQLQGVNLNGRLTWQAGLYYEKSEPEERSGSLSPVFISCDLSTIGADPNQLRCNDIAGSAFSLGAGLPPNSIQVGFIGNTYAEVSYENKAAYTQATYDINDNLSVTAGVRYTVDETKSKGAQVTHEFAGDLIAGGYSAPFSTTVLATTPKVKSEEPTWLLGLDYKPTDDMLLYAKWARGYRQGSVNPAGVSPLDTHGPEQVDTYEIGLKSSWQGGMPGTFNVSAFYNDFQDQQIQIGIITPAAFTTAIVNAGTSTISGLEIEASLQPLAGLDFNLSYAFLDTEIDELSIPDLPAGVTLSSVSANVGEDLPFAPKHKAVLSTRYLLPLASPLGDISVGASYVYVDKQQTTSPQVSPYAILPSYELLNLNLEWQGIAGSAFDAALFATNALDEEYASTVIGSWGNGFETRQVGASRMWGVRVSYSFE